MNTDPQAAISSLRPVIATQVRVFSKRRYDAYFNQFSNID
jgi:hypothetical protein